MPLIDVLKRSYHVDFTNSDLFTTLEQAFMSEFFESATGDYSVLFRIYSQSSAYGVAIADDQRQAIFWTNVYIFKSFPHSHVELNDTQRDWSRTAVTTDIAAVWIGRIYFEVDGVISLRYCNGDNSMDLQTSVEQLHYYLISDPEAAARLHQEILQFGLRKLIMQGAN